ncbi:MAG: hypothetical protein ACSHX3_13155 [Litorimonas sp.]
MVKQSSFAAAILVSFSLGGCASIPAPDEVEVECDTSPKCTGRIKWETSGANYSGLGQVGLVNAKMDFGSSNVALIPTNIRPASISVKLNGSLVGMMATTYSYSGTAIEPEFGNDVTNWLSQHDGQIDEIEITFSNINVQPVGGANTVVGQVVVNNTVIGGDADSWYEVETPLKRINEEIGGE